MTISARFFVSGIEYIDLNNLTVNKSVSQNNAVSSFKAMLDNPYGRHATDFQINNEVKIWAGPEIHGMQGYWKFEEGSGALASDSFAQFNGSIVSGTAINRWTTGILGSAVIGSPTYFQVSGINPSTFSELSISLWFYPYTMSTGFSAIVSQTNANTGENGFWFRDTNNTSGQFSIFSGTSSVNISLGGINMNQWNHIVMTNNNVSKRMAVYLNGVERGTASNSYMSAVSGDNRFTVGKRSNSAGAYMSGAFDNLKIWNRILSPDDMLIDYNLGLGIEEENIFTGTVETIDFQGQGLDEKVTLLGNDYSSRLLDNTVPPTVYTNTEIGSIARDIISTNLTEIGSKNIQSTTTTLRRISFNEVPIYEAIHRLADLSGYTFYVDNNKDMHFELAGSFSTGILLNSGNIIRSIIDKTKEGMANVVKVYGDRYLTAVPRETFTVTGQGSVFTLIHKPHDTSVSTSITQGNGSLLKGGIWEANQTVYSGVDYLVNFDDKQIIIISGNNALINYNNLPANNGSIVVDYNRSLPIVKAVEDSISVQLFGAKTKIINDKSIKDPNTAKAIVLQEIQKANPLDNLQVDLKGWFNFQPSQTVNLSLPNFNSTISGVPIVQITYDINPESSLNERVISVILDKRPIDLTDTIRGINQRLEQLEAQDRLETDILTRIQYATGSSLIVGSYYAVTAFVLGSAFRLWGTDNVPPTGSDGVTKIRLGLLVSGDITHASWVGSVSYLASGNSIRYTPGSVLVSGGYYF